MTEGEAVRASDVEPVAELVLAAVEALLAADDLHFYGLLDAFVSRVFAWLHGDEASVILIFPNAGLWRTIPNRAAGGVCD